MGILINLLACLPFCCFFWCVCVCMCVCVCVCVCTRDTIFGAVYTSLRKKWNRALPPEREWVANTAAAALATVASGPLNYAQNIQYNTSSRLLQPTILETLRQLTAETLSQPTLGARISFVQVCDTLASILLSRSTLCFSLIFAFSLSCFFCASHPPRTSSSQSSSFTSIVITFLILLRWCHDAGTPSYRMGNDTRCDRYGIWSVVVQRVCRIKELC